MAVTMQQIAQEAGVSLGTVSNVLNNRTNVKKKNYDKVMAAVEKLKYQRGPAVDTLKMPFPSNFALLLPDTARAFYSELIRGVEDAAWSAGYGMMLGSFDRIKSKQRQYMEMYARKNLAGIIIHKPMSSCDTINEYFGDRTVVLLDANDSYRGKFPIINADDRGGMRAAMQFLYDHGHRRIAYISGLFEVESSVRRLNVYKEFLVEKGIGIEEALIKNGNYDWHSGYTQASALLRLVNPPTAIFAANDLMAIGAIKAAYERGLRVPGDISIMGHDDIEMAALYMPP